MPGKKMGAPLRIPALTGDPVRDLIITIRADLELSQAKLGRLLKVSEGTVRHWEAGHWKPPEPEQSLIEQLAKKAKKRRTDQDPAKPKSTKTKN